MAGQRSGHPERSVGGQAGEAQSKDLILSRCVEARRVVGDEGSESIGFESPHYRRSCTDDQNAAQAFTGTAYFERKAKRPPQKDDRRDWIYSTIHARHHDELRIVSFVLFASCSPFFGGSRPLSRFGHTGHLFQRCSARISPSSIEVTMALPRRPARGSGRPMQWPSR